jgi:uncharacterized protein (DUF302 family)
MIQETYGMTVTVERSVADAEAAVREALQAEGFGVLTEIDIAATFAAKLGVERAPYKILGACNPVLANQALGSDDRIGLLLPCNVIVAESDQGTVVSILDPNVLVAVAGDEPAVKALASEVRSRMERVLAAL